MIFNYLKILEDKDMSKSRKRRSRELAEKLVRLGFKWYPEFQTIQKSLTPYQQRSMLKRHLVLKHVEAGCKWMTMAHTNGLRSWSFVVEGVRVSDIIAAGLPKSYYEAYGDNAVWFKLVDREDVHRVLDYLELLKIIAKT